MAACRPGQSAGSGRRLWNEVATQPFQNRRKNGDYAGKKTGAEAPDDEPKTLIKNRGAAA
jgi:hypothetical protein